MEEKVEYINLGQWFHSYGFHRDQGTFPGKLLYQRLEPLVERCEREDRILELDLRDMKTLHASFFDGAFGKFIDRFGDAFFQKMRFVTSNTRFEATISNVFAKHKDKDFNKSIRRG